MHCTQEGRVVAASVVDHAIPHKGDMVAFWVTSNWQSLCKHHHDVKTATEDGGFGRPKT
nr:HNH endonuclease [Herminiimonas sp. CN]